MIGFWQKFGQGEPPQDGEGLVYIRHSGDIIDVLEGRGAEVVFAVHRYGSLYDGNGNIYGVPYGCWWTSLPHTDQRASI